MPIVFSTQAKGFRWALEVHEKEMALFSAKDRNNMIRTAIISGGQLWSDVFLPLRFNVSYAYKLGYQVSGRWLRLKEKFLGKAIPYVGYTPPGGYGHNGEKMAVAVQKVHSTAAVHGAECSLTIHIPIGHPIRPETSKSFHRLPESEVARIAIQIHDTISAIIDGATTNTKGPHKLSIPEQSRIPPHRKVKQGPKRNPYGFANMHNAKYRKVA